MQSIDFGIFIVKFWYFLLGDKNFGQVSLCIFEAISHSNLILTAELKKAKKELHCQISSEYVKI